MELAHDIDAVSTAARILRNGSTPVTISCVEISRPSEASAKGSNGQIFIAVIPMSRSELR